MDSSYGGGRVFIGEKAYKYGLVQGLGGLDAALKEARKRANIGEGNDIELVPILTGGSNIIRDPSASALIDFVLGAERVQFWALDPLLWEGAE